MGGCNIIKLILIGQDIQGPQWPGVVVSDWNLPGVSLAGAEDWIEQSQIALQN